MPRSWTTRTSSRRSRGAGNTINKLVPRPRARGPDDGTRRANIVGRRQREVVVEGFDSLPLRRDDVVRGFRRVLLEVGELVPQELDLVQGVVAVPVWKAWGAGNPIFTQKQTCTGSSASSLVVYRRGGRGSPCV